MNTSKIYITTTKVLNRNGQRPINFTFDCVTDYSPVFKRSISTFPVSTKANLGDHIFSENTTLKLVAMVTATPLLGAIDNNVIDTELGLGRVQKAYDEILQLHKRSEPLTLVSEFDVINNLYLTEVVPVQDNNAIMFTLSFEQQKFASYRSVTLVRNVSENLAADNATTNNGAGGQGYKWEDGTERNPLGLKKIDENSSIGKRASDISSNLSKVSEDILNKLIADPVAPK